jgi:hypothetical protein
VAWQPPAPDGYGYAPASLMPGPLRVFTFAAPVPAMPALTERSIP